jgi:hypothetical protein
MTETLQEFCDWRGSAARVDRPAGVIRGVKLLGLESRNGRSYLPEALAQAVPLYEDAKVHVNHPKAAAAGPRDYQDRIGTVRNVAAQADGLFGDFHFNPKHQLAEQLLWDAEHAPENVGFSHNVEARTTRRGDRTVVEAIVRVTSVDLVADPATTRGLFEGQEDRLKPELRTQQEDELRRLRAEVERLTALESAHQRRERVRELLREFQLPEPGAADGHGRSIVSRPFIESLLAAPDDRTMRAMVEERAALVRTLGASMPVGKPLSRDQYRVDASPRMDAKTFVEAIT